jgi:hypothetical protein
MPEINDLLVENFYRTELTATVAVGDNTVSVVNASGFPAPSAGTYFYLTLINELGTKEIVKIGGVSGNTLTLFGTDTVANTYLYTNSRAEHWFTAEAFRDIQAAIDGLGGEVVTPPDGTTIVGGATLSVGVIQAANIAADQINNTHLADNSVAREQIQAGEVVNLHIDNTAGIDASKIRSFLASKLPLDTIPQITFSQIDYDVGVPSGGADGDIFIEWEDYTP